MKRLFGSLERGYRLLFALIGLELVMAMLLGHKGVPMRSLFAIQLTVTPFPVVAWLTPIAARIIARGTHRPLATLRRVIWTRRIWLLRGIICTATCLAMADGFVALKNAIPKLVPFYADPDLIEADRILFGVDPWRITHAYLGPIGTMLIDRVYVLWFLVTAGFVCWISFTRDARLQLRGMLAFNASWILLGGVMATLFSSVGPWDYRAAFGDSRFDPLMAQLGAYHQSFGLKSFATMDFLLRTQINPQFGSGISAMPSLHVAIAFLIFLACRRVNLGLALLSFAFFAAIALGSVHLGWHYAVDGLAGSIGAALIWWLSGRLVDWLAAPAAATLQREPNAASLTGTIVSIAEKAWVVMLAANLLLRLMPQISGDPLILCYLANELASATLVLFQKRGSISQRPYVVAIAFVGTSIALMVSAQGSSVAPQWVADGLIVAGLVLALLAKLALRRSFGLIAANRGVRVGGPYRLVRHPMYSGYMLSHIGYLLGHFSLWNCGVYALTWGLIWLRIAEEERLLGEDERYRAYRLQVPARLIPALL